MDWYLPTFPPDARSQVTAFTPVVRSNEENLRTCEIAVACHSRGMDTSRGMDFTWQPVADYRELAEAIDSDVLFEGMQLADSVRFHPGYFDEYSATVRGAKVTYEGVGSSSSASCSRCCSCGADYCRHIAAVALLVLGCGHVPPEAEAALVGPVFDVDEVIDSMTPESMREVLRAMTRSRAAVTPMLRMRASLNATFSDGAWLTADPNSAPRHKLETQLASLKAMAGNIDYLDAAVAEFCGLADRFIAAGFGDRISPLLFDAVRVAREATRELVAQPSQPPSAEHIAIMREIDSTGLELDLTPQPVDRERLGAFVPQLVTRLVDARPAQDDRLLSSVIGILAEDAPGEATISNGQLQALLSPPQLAQLLDWLEGRECQSLGALRRQMTLAGYIGNVDRMRRIADRTVIAAFDAGLPDEAMGALLTAYDRSDDAENRARDLAAEWLATREPGNRGGVTAAEIYKVVDDYFLLDEE